MADEVKSLDQVIKEASDAAVLEQKPATEEKPAGEETPAGETPKDGEQPKSEEAPKDELTDEEKKNALDLFKVLKRGDASSAAIIDKLATESGYAKITTKAEAQEATQEIKDKLQEALGDEYGHLAAKLVPAIKEYVKDALAEGTAELKAHKESTELEKLTQRSTNVLNELGKEFYESGTIPTEVDAEMTVLMNRYPPSGGVEVEDYVKDMFNMAVSKLGKVPLNTESRKRLTTSKTNVPALLDGTKGRPTPETTNGSKVDRSKAMSVDEAVRAAVDEENAKLKATN